MCHTDSKAQVKDIMVKIRQVFEFHSPWVKCGFLTVSLVNLDRKKQCYIQRKCEYVLRILIFLCIP